MLKVIKFCKVRNQFLTKMENDIKSVKQGNKKLTIANRT